MGINEPSAWCLCTKFVQHALTSVPCFRIWGHFPPFHLLRFGVIFHHSTVPPFHRSTILPFHHSTVPPFHRSTILPFHRSTIPPFHHSTVPPFHRSTVPPFHHSTIPPFHRSTVPPFHRSTVPAFRVALTRRHVSTSFHQECSDRFCQSAKHSLGAFKV